MIQFLKNIMVFAIVMVVIKYVWVEIYNGIVKLRMNYNTIWNDYFVDVKIYYANMFRQIPNIYFLGDVDVAKVLEYIRTIYPAEIVEIKLHSYHNRELNKGFFNYTIIEMKNKRIVELSHDHLFIYYSKNQYNWVKELMIGLKNFTTVKEVTEEERKDVVKVIGFAQQATMN